MQNIRKSFYVVSITAIFFLFITMLSSDKVYGAQVDYPQSSLRVALALNLASAEFSVSQGEYEIIDYLTQRVISNGNASGNWVVAPKGGQNMQLSNNGSPVGGLVSSMVILRQKDATQLNIFQFKNKRYRGDLVIENMNGSINIINLIDVEQYLYGVVPAEIGVGAPLESCKAQAVVSRTYAMYYKQNPQLYYDLGITQQWQVYGGYDTELAGGITSKQAVDETRGLAIYFENKIIQAFFHSNSGGYTESVENVWFTKLPYLRPTATPEDAYATQVMQSGEWPAISYQWEKNFTKKELTDRIQQWNADNPQEKIGVGAITDIVASRLAIDPETRGYLSQQTLSGRVTQLDFIGVSGIKSFYRDHIRSVLGLRSTLFQVGFDSMVKIWNAYSGLEVVNQTVNLLGVTVDGQITKLNGVNTDYYVVSASGVQVLPKAYTKVTFQGKGYGHGLGMSQWGARGLAAKGIAYREIIEHFYNQDYYDGRLNVKSCY